MSFAPQTFVNSYASEVYESTVSDFFSLLKPRVMSLVVFSGTCGMLLAPGHLHPFLAIITVFCIALASGASGAINMWYDRDIDAIMKRTQTRAIPAGKIHPDEALGFGLITAIASVIIMTISTNLVAGALLAAAILFYVIIYTILLKRRTPQNIVIGGAAGAFPPLIGWAAVTGDVTLMPVILFMIIFIWTPPHFWALSLLIKDEYAKVNVPMLPVFAGVKVTKANIFGYSLVLTVTALTPYIIGFSGFIYLAIAVPLNLVFMYLCYKLMREENHTFAGKTFGFSIIYLFAIFLALVVDKLVS